MDWNKIFEYHKGNLLRKYSKDPLNHVGWVNSCGYLQTEYAGKTYMVHRIIWEMFNGALAREQQIDHIDRDPLNNKIENLRVCTQSQNQINSRTPRNNTSGYKGVLKTPSGKFQARLGFNGKKLYLGLFNSAEEAAECVKRVTKELYGEFADSL